MNATAEPGCLDLAAWDALFRSKRKNPLFWGRPRLIEARDGGDWQILPSRLMRIVCPFLAILFGAFVLSLGLGDVRALHHAADLKNPELLRRVLLLNGFGLFAIGFGILCMLRRNRITGSATAGTITVHWGVWPLRRKLELPVQDMAVRLHVIKEDPIPARIGWTSVSIHPKYTPDQPLKVCIRRTRELMVPAFMFLSRMGLEATDQTVASVKLSTGEGLRVSQNNVGGDATLLASMKMKILSDRVICLKPTLAGRALPAFISAAGITVVVMMLCYSSAHPNGSRAGLIFAYVFGAVALMWGLSGLLGFRRGLRPVRIDKDLGLLTIGANGLLQTKEEYLLRDIVAVQVCPIGSMGIDNKYQFKALELNLVLNDPPGQRIHIMAHGQQARLRKDAALLASFLNVPLLSDS